MSSSDRLTRYLTLAAVPMAATSAAVADTYHASSSTPVTVSASGSSSSQRATLFTVLGDRFRIQVSQSSSYATAIIRKMDNRGGPLKGFFNEQSQARTVSAAASPDFASLDVWWSSYSGGPNPSGTLDTGRHFLGFISGDPNGTTVSGFFEYELISNGSSVSLTIHQWAYNLDSPITMPASNAGGAVPGLGGLAALACGAAGVRRRRQRAA